MKRGYFLITVLVLVSFISVKGSGNIKIVFRYDDYILTHSALNDSLLNVFQRNKIQLCLGIIPFDSSGLLINHFDIEEIDALKSRIEKGEIEIALHGFNHRNHIRKVFLTRPSYSEFSTLSFDKQLNMIGKGKKALDSLLQSNIQIFVPPFNTYDNNTLKALEGLGFTIISGSMSASSKGRVIKYMPVTYEDFSELTKIVEDNKGNDVTIILYFHPYSFKESNSGRYNLVSVSQLDSLLRRVKNHGIIFYTFSKLDGEGNFDNLLYRYNTYKFNLLKNGLNKLKIYNYGIYRPHESSALKAGFFFANILFHLLSLILVYFAVTLLLKVLKPGLIISSLILALLAIPVLLYLYYIRNDFSFWMLLIFSCVNLIAVISAILHHYRQIHAGILR